MKMYLCVLLRWSKMAPIMFCCGECQWYCLVVLEAQLLPSKNFFCSVMAHLKWWKMFFISFLKFFSFLRYLNSSFLRYPDFFGHIGKSLVKKTKINFKFTTSQLGNINYNTHIAWDLKEQCQSYNEIWSVNITWETFFFKNHVGTLVPNFIVFQKSIEVKHLNFRQSLT